MNISIQAAANQCESLAVRFSVRADKAPERDHQSGQYGNWRHDAEILLMAARILRRETATPEPDSVVKDSLTTPFAVLREREKGAK